MLGLSKILHAFSRNKPNGALASWNKSTEPFVIKKYSITNELGFPSVKPPYTADGYVLPDFSNLTYERLQKYCTTKEFTHLKNSGLFAIHPLSVIIDNKVLLPYSGNHQTFDEQNHPAFKYGNYKKVESIPGKTLVLATCGADKNFFYWTVVLMQKIGFIRQAGLKLSDFDQILINPIKYPYQKQLNSLFGLDNCRLIELEYGTLYRCDEMVVFLHSRDNYWGYRFVREQILPFADNSIVTPKRIYIRRGKGSKGRNIENEEALLSFLESFGFSGVFLENYNITQQAALLNAAEVVVAPHGAGLVNLLFANPGTKVIELINDASVNVVYYLHSIFNELAYGYLICKSVDADQIPAHQRNLSVNMEELAVLFEKMGITKN